MENNEMEDNFQNVSALITTEEYKIKNENNSYGSYSTNQQILSEIDLVLNEDKYLFSSSIYLRKPTPEDIEVVESLHIECLPVRYDKAFFQNIVNHHVASVLAVDNETNIVVGIITWQINPRQLSEDSEGVISIYLTDVDLTYICTLCVTNKYRKKGIASIMLKETIRLVELNTKCKAIYLHVLSTNNPAISFYQKHEFIQRNFLQNFYRINGAWCDSFLYVKYINGGCPPAANETKSLSQSFYDWVYSWMNYILSFADLP